ncbi:MAG: S-adenosylmethionine:tRNA ribosyltransferase-isomerase [Pseudonocardiales bacterium]|nr:S-adenosylmethionine:tRNA ribosyltransferase-isomerase [Pseudonocardiales bacterium]
MSELDFDLPEALAASAPPPRRDRVRLLVAGRTGIQHARFNEFASFLASGDLLVVNTSATLAAAVDGRRADGRAVTVHFSTALDDGEWVVELRPPVHATGPLPDVTAGERVELPDGVLLTVLAPASPDNLAQRLWRARVAVEGDVETFLARAGRPIRYGYVPDPHPLSDYQTVFARRPGSAEMPSAGRPFTAEIVTDLVVRGVGVAPLLLHAGVSSQEAGEAPLPERFEVPPATARLVNVTRAAGGRVVAVGTTVTRALESAADPDGRVHARAGWTDLILGSQRPARVISGLVTGWHAPGASHLQLLQAVAGAELVHRAYAAALRHRYLWHEFGDSCLLLP